MENCLQSKFIYHQLCDSHPEIPLFLQAWWMETICLGKDWDVILIRNNSGDIVAFMPYLLVKKWGLKMVLQPLLSQTNGVWIFFKGNESDNEKTILNKMVADTLEKELKRLKLVWFFQYFHPQSSIPNILKKRGFVISSRQTFVIPDISDEKKLLNSFSSAKQRQIRKAIRNNLRVDFTISPEDFVSFHTACLKQRGETNFHTSEVEISLCREAINRSQGAIIRVLDTENNLHSALFFVWDASTAYYLIPAIDSNYRSSGASTLMVWEAIKMVKNKVKRFDFEGSMDENIARSYKQFGTERVEYAKVERVNSFLIRLLKIFKGAK
jgi:hypothetical protein